MIREINFYPVFIGRWWHWLQEWCCKNRW